VRSGPVPAIQIVTWIILTFHITAAPAEPSSQPDVHFYTLMSQTARLLAKMLIFVYAYLCYQGNLILYLAKHMATLHSDNVVSEEKERL